MNNIIYGIITIAICISGILLAFRLKADRPKLALLLLILSGMLLRIYTSCDFFLHEWDERYHALAAKNLLGHWLKPTLYENPVIPFDFRDWPVGNIWLHKQPLTLWLIALSLKIFGINEFAVRIPSIIFSTIGIKLIWDVARDLFSKETAFISAFLFAIHGSIIELAAGRHATDHVDIAFLFFILLAIWCCVKYLSNSKMPLLIAGGVAIGAAVLCKWLPAFIVIPVWLCFSYGKITIGKQLTGTALLIVAAVAVFLPWQLYILHHYNKEALYVYQYNAMHISQVLCDQGGNFFYHFDCLRMAYGELIYIPIIWGTYYYIKTKQIAKVGLLIWFWVPYLFFSYCATKMSAYTLFAAPAVFIIAADAYGYFMSRQQSKYTLLLKILCYGLLLLPVRYTIERVKPFTNLERLPEWSEDIHNFAATPGNNSHTVIFNCEHSIEMMFATQCICYKQRADSATVIMLKQQGYTVLEKNGKHMVVQ